MKICGIVAEYNPFHNGHQYQLAETRRALGEDTALVCVLSGNFTQRGEPAVFLKHPRAEAAVRCGADLVLELPLPWAMASAEGFARGAVSLLSATGLVTHLSFGSECGDLGELESAARVLLDPALSPLLREELSSGAPFAAARQGAAERLAGRTLPVLRSPNDILGVEYLKAVMALGLPMEAVAIRREGAAHDAASGAGEKRSSGLELRKKLAASEPVSDYIPNGALEVFQRELSAGRGPLLPSALALPLLSRLRMLPGSAFAALPDAGEGIENRLCRASREAGGLEELYASAATKRYTLARVRRMLWGAALGLRREDSAGTPPYLRVLAANSRGRELLGRMRKSAALPLVTKPAAVGELGERAGRVFSLEAAAADFYRLGLSAPSERRGDMEWRTGPVMIESLTGSE